MEGDGSRMLIWTESVSSLIQSTGSEITRIICMSGILVEFSFYKSDSLLECHS